MRISRIGIALAFIGLFSISCGSKRDTSAFFDEGRIEGNTYISDSTRWKMSIPEGWKLSLKMDAKESQGMDNVYSQAEVLVSPKSSIIQSISSEKDRWNIFSASYGIADYELNKSMVIGRNLLPSNMQKIAWCFKERL